MSAHRILLVEDDDAVREIVRLSLESLGGHRVCALRCGEEALAQAAGFAPELLLLDMAMPGTDGLRTLARLRRQPALRGVPAVLLTARTQARDMEAYRTLGVADVIAKPFDPARLCERIDAALPRAAGNAPAGAPQQPLALVVEDDPGIRYLLGFILEQQGFRVESAEDGPQALAALADGPPADVVILDVMLPGLDGLTLLEHLRAQARWREVPVLMLTAQGDERTVARAFAAGAQDYLGKPFDPAELAARLARLPRRPAAAA